jgi:hypothetical protein
MLDGPSLAVDEPLETLGGAVAAAVPGAAPRRDRGRAEAAELIETIASCWHEPAAGMTV